MRKIFASISVFAIVIVLSACSSVPTLSFTEKITINYKSDYMTTKTVTISDVGEIDDIIKTLTVNTSNGSGKCEFSLLELIFEGQGKSVSIYPTPESCGSVRVGNSDYYVLSEENHVKLFEILENHNIFFDFQSKNDSG